MNTPQHSRALRLRHRLKVVAAILFVIWIADYLLRGVGEAANPGGRW